MSNIVIIESGSILEGGIETILRKEQGFSVTSVPYRGDDASLVAELAVVRPDVIVLNEDGPLSSEHLFDILVGWSFSVAIRVVVIRMEDNWIDVYQRRRIFATQVSDLIGVFKHETARA